MKWVSCRRSWCSLITERNRQPEQEREAKRGFRGRWKVADRLHTKNVRQQIWSNAQELRNGDPSLPRVKNTYIQLQLYLDLTNTPEKYLL